MTWAATLSLPFSLKNVGTVLNIDNKKLDEAQKEGGDAVDRLVQEARVEGMTPEEKIEYYKNMRNEFDIESEKWFARQEGIEEGMAKGMAKGEAVGIAKVAKELKAIKINPKQIAKATGLSVEQIAAL